MDSALVGYTGLVGSTLLRKANFNHLYRSTNFEEAKGQTFDTLVFAGARAEKWKANLDPEIDRAHILDLVRILKETKSSQATLISTVDVYPKPTQENERLIDASEANHAYGANRAFLENEFLKIFANSVVVRLPALFGTGLKKNVVYDFLNSNNVEKIDSRGRFQFYDLNWLDSDLKKIWEIKEAQGERVFNLTSEPVAVSEVAQSLLNTAFENITASSPASYDIRSKMAEEWNGQNGYLYSKTQVLNGLAKFGSDYRKENSK